MKRKVYIRADGSPEIGLGHLVRCLALAHMLKSDFDITFFCVQIPEKIRQEVVDANFKFEQVTDEGSFLHTLNPEILVILDGYQFDTAYQKKIKKAGCKLVCIDDLHDKEFFADVIINHAPGVLPGDYKAQAYTKYALGHEYAILRPAFLEQAQKERKKSKQDIVLICFGGSDIKNLTQSALVSVLQFSFFKKIIVVTGSAYPYLNSLAEFISNHDNIEHHYAITESKMLECLLESDVAIVPASGILFEALAVGCKVISGYYVNNQMGIYNGFLNLSAIIDAKDFSEVSLVDSLNNVNNNSIIRILDGKSSGRLHDIIAQL